MIKKGLLKFTCFSRVLYLWDVLIHCFVGIGCDLHEKNHTAMKNKLSISDRKIIQKSFLPDFYHGKECWTNGKLPEDYTFYFSEVAFDKKEEQGQEQSFSYINNPDGSVRWIFASNSRFPGFLDLYNNSGFKGKLLSLVFRILFIFRLQFLVVSGQFYFYTRQLSLQESWKLKMDFDSFSVFTGTVGPNRKVLFALHKKNKTIGFVKHPINYNSLCLVSTENMILKAMEEHQFTVIDKPKAKYLGNGDVYVNNIKPLRTNSTNKFTDTHALALKDLYSIDNGLVTLKQSRFYRDLKTMITDFKYNSHVPFHREICDQIKGLFESIDIDENVNMTWAHMDFTPWNLFLARNEKKLHVIDWELSKPGMPMLFDLFHFVFQSQILIEKKNYKSIYQNIEEIISQNATVKKLVNEFHIDVKLHFRLYLLHNISYYLTIYQKQTKLHEQVNWLTLVWKNALESELKRVGTESHRNVFITDLFHFMQDKRYAWLHSCDAQKSNISSSSDLDFLITKSIKKDVISFCESHILIARLKCFQKTFMSTLDLFFSDGSYLSLDLITDFVRKNLAFMDANEVLDSVCFNTEGIKMPSKECDLNYLIAFYTLNNASIPKKYQDFFRNLNEDEQNTMCQFIYSRYGFYGTNLNQIFDSLPNQAALVKTQIASENTNTGFNFLANSLRYVIDTTRSLVFQKGLIISFSGVDGAGKSTIINDVAQRLKRDYRKKVIVLRHRPSLFPILSAFRYGKKEAEKRAAKTLPHQGNNRSAISSIMRFAYYYIDYLLGQIYIRIKYVSRGYVVLYDRYYFDFINDPRRSNISISKKLVNNLYGLIDKPKHNFFFYASPEIIRQRKQELSANEISRLTMNYFATFNRLKKKYASSQYHCIENINRNETVHKIFNQVQNSL